MTAAGGGIAPHLLSPDVDMTGLSEDELRFLVLRSRLRSGEMPMQAGQGPLGADHTALSRPAAQLAPVCPGTAGFASAGGGLVGLTREVTHPSPGPLLLGAPTGGIQGNQVAQTLAVPSGLLLDNYKALSVLGSEPLKGRILQQAGVEQAPVGVGSPDSGDLQVPGRQTSIPFLTPDSEEQLLRTQKKREKNRIAQQRFRLRQKQLVSDLQEELARKSKEIEELKQAKFRVEEENRALRKALEQMDVDVDKVLQPNNSQEEPQSAAMEKNEAEGSQSKEADSMCRDTNNDEEV